MTDPSIGPLQEASMNELVDELFRRTESCLIIWMLDRADARENASVTKHSYHGGTYRVLGMIEVTKAVMLAGQVFDDDCLYDPEKA